MGKIKIDGMNINYLKHGSGPDMIFLHGLLGDLRSYSGLLKILSEHYSVYAVDLPMHGSSDFPEEYMSISDMAVMLGSFAKKLNIKNPTLCSHSGGSLVSLEYALSNDVKELIFMDPAGIEPYDSEFRLMARLFMANMLKNIRLGPFRAFKFMKVSSSNLFRNILNRNFWRLLKDNEKRECIDKIRALRCDVTVLWGTHDRVFRYKNMARLFQLPNCRIVAVEGNHYWPLIKPEGILGVLDVIHKKDTKE